MAKDDIHSTDADLHRHSDTHGTVGSDDESASEGVRDRTLVYLEGRFRGRPDEPVVNRTEATTADESGLLEAKTLRMKAASGCGHVLHVAQEMGLQCTSCVRLRRPESNILCTECANDDRNACSVCNTTVCHGCREKRWMEGEFKTVCRACVRTRIRWQFVATTAKYVVVAVGVYYIIFY